MRDEPPLPDDRDAVADALDLGEHVGREEDRPSVGLERIEDLVERALHQRIEALGRLVENRQLGIVLQRLDDADLLAHAARVIADQPLQRGRRQLQPLAQLAAPDGRTAGQLAEIVEQPFSGQRVVERDAAGQVADPAPDRHGVADDVEAEHAAVAGGWMQESEQQPDGRALPCSVGTKEPEHFALADDEIERFQGANLVAVVFGEAGGFNRWVSHCRGRRGSRGRRAQRRTSNPNPSCTLARVGGTGRRAVAGVQSSELLEGR